MLQIFSRSFNLTHKAAYWIITVLILSGCVFNKIQPDLNVAYVNLGSTPFFPQSEYQCGPAALATLLVSSGVQVTSDDLAEKVYIPKRKGSLQIEMIAATREYGRIPYLLDPTLSNVLDELHQGRPVLVFQNLGLQVKPVWHYAVVIGYDPEANEIVLRSGTNANKRLNVNKFMRSWQRADSWSFVALKPGELPAKVDFDRYFQALNDMSHNSSAQFMLELYLTASQQFAGKSLVWFALGNAYLRSNNHEQAVRAYSHVLELDPDHIAARNNLAFTLGNLSCDEQALAQAKEAIRLSVLAGQFETESRDTLNQITEIIDNKSNHINNCKLAYIPAPVQYETGSAD